MFIAISIVLIVLNFMLVTAYEYLIEKDSWSLFVREIEIAFDNKDIQLTVPP